MGAGAVAGALFLVRVRRRLGPETSSLIATIIYAAVLAILGGKPPLPLAVFVMFFAGVAWTTILSTLSISAQVLLPAWVRARGLAAALTAVFGGMAFGSVFWGIVAGRLGLAVAFEIAAAGLVVSIFPLLAFRLPIGEGPNLEPSGHWHMPHYAGEVAGAEGPVLVLIEYDIAPDDERAFRAAVRQMRSLRLRSGALAWDLYRDPDRPGRYVESFVDRSWDDHLRLHDRVTEADRHVQERVQRFHRGDAPPHVTHLVSTASRGRLFTLGRV
jgi:quinol monooxygenase YgiN